MMVSRSGGGGGSSLGGGTEIINYGSSSHVERQSW